MSNIEPTEEQMQAAREWIDLDLDMKNGVTHIARLLAEREAKLREDMERLHRAVVDTICAAQDAENDTLRARVAELEVEVKAYREANVTVSRELHARAAQLESALGIYFADNEQLLTREAQHLADIKALMAKRLVDMREAARWGAEISANVDDATDHQIAADIMEEFATFDAEDELLQRLAHYDDAKADAPAVSPDCPRESPECITVGFHAVDECERRPTSFPAECPKCQEHTHPFYDVEQARWLCDRCHHPAGEPFVHTEGGEG